MESCLGNLKKELQCSLCSDTLSEPKLTICFHVFCKLCIKRNAQEVDQQQDQAHTFKCPQCDSETLLQDLNDVEDLQNSPVHARMLKVLEFVENQKVCSVSSSHSEALWQCVECDKSLCEECLRCHSAFFTHHQVVSLSDLKEEDVDKLLKREPLCKTHNNQSVEFYCEKCDMLICSRCMNEHHNHTTMTLQDIIAIEQDSLAQKLIQIEEMNSDEEERERQEEIALTLRRDGEKAKQQVKTLTETFIKTLRHNEQQLLNQIQETVTKAEKNLRIISHTTQAQEYIAYFMENSTASEMISRRHQESSPQDFTYDSFNKAISGIEFKPNEEFCEQMKREMGLFRILKKADPLKSSLKVFPYDELEASKNATLVVQMKTSEGEMAQETLENIEIMFTPQDAVNVVEIQTKEYGKLSLDFIPTVPGQLTSTIEIHGSPVSNSPIQIPVNPQKITINTRQSKLKDALNSGGNTFTGIAVNKENTKIAVADSQSHCVRVFSMEGDLLLTYGSYGSGQVQLNNPSGLAFLGETELVIADNGNKRICLIDTITGHLVRVLGSHTASSPSHIHVDDDLNIFVSYYDSNLVEVFSDDGAFQYDFSITKPSGITTHNGLLYISDQNTPAIRVLQMNDNQLPTEVAQIVGKDGTADKLKGPQGLAIDGNCNLLVCCDYSQTTYDNYYGNYNTNHSYFISKFTLDGCYIGQTSQLNNNPCNIVVLGDGEVICTTLGNGVLFLEN